MFLLIFINNLFVFFILWLVFFAPTLLVYIILQVRARDIEPARVSGHSGVLMNTSRRTQVTILACCFGGRGGRECERERKRN